MLEMIGRAGGSAAPPDTSRGASVDETNMQFSTPFRLRRAVRCEDPSRSSSPGLLPSPCRRLLGTQVSMSRKKSSNPRCTSEEDCPGRVRVRLYSGYEFLFFEMEANCAVWAEYREPAISAAAAFIREIQSVKTEKPIDVPPTVENGLRMFPRRSLKIHAEGHSRRRISGAESGSKSVFPPRVQGAVPIRVRG
jgi:hypothetical protein